MFTKLVLVRLPPKNGVSHTKTEKPSVLLYFVGPLLVAPLVRGRAGFLTHINMYFAAKLTFLDKMNVRGTV